MKRLSPLTKLVTISDVSVSVVIKVKSVLDMNIGFQLSAFKFFVKNHKTLKYGNKG